ncbi:MAG: hypothetical protein K2M94_06595 [Paramuribaculum sp.]|nr:hypothetical protein [Paramuribaculum sp.]
MSDTNSHHILRALIAGLFAIITIFAYGMVLVLQDDTLITPWIPVMLSLAIAVVTADRCLHAWSRLTGYTNRWINTACHVIAVTGAIAAIFYSLNYFLSDKSSTQMQPVVVESRYTETHHHTRRVGRGHYVQGSPYKVHYVNVRFENGKEKAVLLPLKEYKYTHIGDTLMFELQRGFLGIPVIKRSKTPARSNK